MTLHLLCAIALLVSSASSYRIITGAHQRSLIRPALRPSPAAVTMLAGKKKKKKKKSKPSGGGAASPSPAAPDVPTPMLVPDDVVAPAAFAAPPPPPPPPPAPPTRGPSPYAPAGADAVADDGALDDGEPTPTLDLGLLSMVEDESANPLPSLAELDRRRAAAGDGSGGLPPPPAASELEPPPFELPSFELPGGGGDGGGLGGLLGGLLGGGDAAAPPPAAEADSKLPAINPGQKRVYEAEEKPPIEKFVFNLTWAGIAFLVLVEIFINTPLFQTVKPAVLGFMGDDSGAKAAAPSLAGAWDAVGVRPVFLPPDGAAAPAAAPAEAPVVDSAADAAAASLAAAADAAAKAAALLDQ